MRLISLNVGLPQEVVWRGKPVVTGIFKAPVSGPLRLEPLNLDGDRQADLSVHGGTYKAVYAYPSEHYAFWRAELPDRDLPWGVFGENFTTEGLDENRLVVGDRLRLGTAVLRVTEPRVPCYKLGLRFGDPEMTKRFLEARRSGFYLAVLQAGVVEAGQPFELLERPDHGLTVAQMNSLYASPNADPALMDRFLELNLSEAWRTYLQMQVNTRSS
ncbi:MAG TPA: MOSC domain-containing protein [Roseiflexaceae bacterium]|nr:MOSC domain-containing protein [Roseiflexaceae bacterium]